MTEQWSVPVWVAVGVLLALVVLVAGLVVALRRARSAAAAERVRLDQETASLRAQVEEIERRLSVPAGAAASQEYLITGLGGQVEPAHRDHRVDQDPVVRPDASLFADLVLRETVVQAASLAHGLRRALSPQVRNRVRFEMRRELKRARRQRRADLRDARRDWAARQRAGIGPEDTAA